MSKDYCPKCCQNTNHESLFKNAFSANNMDFGWSQDHEIIKCKGCENIQFRYSYSDESMFGWDDENQVEYQYEDKKYFPKFLKDHKQLTNISSTPEKIRIVYNESIEALKNNCYLLSAVGLRAVIESVCIEQKITGRNLEIKINNLVKNKLITQKDCNRLHSIRFLGNDSVHEMDVPKEEKLKIALDTMITDFEDFKNLFLKKFAHLPFDEEKSIKEVLGKHFRRIEPTYLLNFTQLLIDDINSFDYKWINVGSVKVSSVENSPVQHFIRKKG
jgi:hypothetical protein